MEPGGRLICVVPNGDCPIVRNTSARFSGLYAAPSPDELLTGIKRLAHVESSAIRGRTFSPTSASIPIVSPSGMSHRSARTLRTGCNSWS